MQIVSTDIQKSGFLYRLWQKILGYMGNKRFYPEIQTIESMLIESTPGNRDVPSNWAVLKALVMLAGITIIRLYHKYFWVEQWFLILSNNDGTEIRFKDCKKIFPPNDRFWADPHIIKQENAYYLFVEEFIYHQKRGSISVVEIDESGNIIKSIPVLQKPYHLSYPCTFSDKNKIYMIPETAENKTIDLYECTRLPNEWRFVKHLLENVIAVDSTMFYYSDLWWLFTAMPDGSDALPKVKLFLFYAESLFSDEWKSHPKNPVITDQFTSRPAGNIFVNDGKIYRPSQNSKKGYGQGIDINEISTLSKTDYVERKTRSIKPNGEKFITGTHTFAYQEQMTVLDACRRIPKIFVKTKS
jgi:hypothetical protein